MSEIEPVLSAIISYDDRWIVFLCGELDVSSGEELKYLAEAISAASQEPVDFDLSGVSFTDIAGWRGICSATRLLNASGTAARIINPSAAVRKVTGVLASSRQRPHSHHTIPTKAA